MKKLLILLLASVPISAQNTMNNSGGTVSVNADNFKLVSTLRNPQQGTYSVACRLSKVNAAAYRCEEGGTIDIESSDGAINLHQPLTKGTILIDIRGAGDRAVYNYHFSAKFDGGGTAQFWHAIKGPMELTATVETGTTTTP